MNEVVVVGAIRSPIGRIRGSLSSVRPDDLLAHVFKALIERTGLDPQLVDEVFAGCANQAGEDNRNIARMSWLLAGYPYEVPGITVNRLCASGLDAVVQGLRSIQVGDNDVVVAGGVESMTRGPVVMEKNAVGFGSGIPQVFDTALGWRFPNPKMKERFPLEAMGETAENIAERYQISREDQDAYALQSHQRALQAWEAGHFAAEVAPITIQERKRSFEFTQDEGPRADTSLDKLASLRAIFRKGGSVTAGNASSLNDGAAAVLLMRRQRAEELALPIMGTILGGASAGVDPRYMGLGPVPATQKLLQRLGLQTSDLDLVEANEAFAVQALAVCQELQLDVDRVNIHGGAIALGHPLGCSGARILTTLVHAMQKEDAGLGLATLCVGVGQGTSVVVKRN